MLKELDEREKVLRKVAQESINKLKKVYYPWNTEVTFLQTWIERKLHKISNIEFEYNFTENKI